MATTLYRKYRPQRFADLVNQQHIRLTLQNAIQHDRLAHAYLFAGPRGVGKTSVARLLARALNCQNRQADGEPCNTCPTCTAMLKNSSLDILEVDAASQTGVDNVRDNIIQSARSSPSLGKFKVFIIDEVHMLSLAAFNALLKLLEEPPAHAVFILATTEVHRVPETIISRTQRFDFKKIGVAEIVTRLNFLAQAEQRQLEASVADRVARASDGSLRDAESTLGQLFSFEQPEITADLADLVLPRSDQATISAIVTAVAHGQAKEALDQFHHFCEDGGDIPRLAHDLVRHSRILMMLALDSQLLADVADEVDQTTGQALLSLSREVGVDRATAMVEGLVEAERQLQRSSFEELPIEVAIIKLCLGQPQPPAAPSLLPTKRSVAAPSTASPTPTPKKRAAHQGGLSLAEAQQVWKKLQSTIGRTHPSLALSVQHAEVVDSRGTTLTVQVPFQLHADRLTDPKHHLVLEQALEQTLGQKIDINVTRGETVPPPPSPAVNEKPTAAPIAAPLTPAKNAKTDLWDQVVTSFT